MGSHKTSGHGLQRIPLSTSGSIRFRGRDGKVIGLYRNDFSRAPIFGKDRRGRRSWLSAFEFWGWRNKDVKAISRKKNDRGLTISSFGVDPSTRIVDYNTKDEFMKGLMESVEVARKLECSRLIVTTGNEIVGTPREAQHHNIVRVLKEASRMLESSDIVLVLEPLNVLVDHTGYYLYSSAEGFEIVR